MNKEKISGIVDSLHAFCKDLFESMSEDFESLADRVTELEDASWVGEYNIKKLQVVVSAYNVIYELNAYLRLGCDWLLDRIDHKDIDTIVDFIKYDRQSQLGILNNFTRYPSLEKAVRKNIEDCDTMYYVLVDIRRLAYGYDRPKNES